jgi:hypothetical protein
MKLLPETYSGQTQSSAGASRLSLVIVLVTIVLIAVATWFFFIRPTGSPDAQLAPPPPPTSKEARPDSARDVISTLKESTPVDYTSAYEQAGEFLDDGKFADAQLLYFFAARGGNGPAAFKLASMYDPVEFDPAVNLMDGPDMFQAYKWYNSALRAGEAAAADKLSALKAWTEQAAASGDQKAEQLLLQWEQ